MSRRKGIPVSFSGRSVTISCIDLERSEQFYAGVLGAVLIPGDGYGCPEYRLGALRISLMPNAQRRSPAIFPEYVMPVLTLEVDDIELAHAHLRDAGAAVLQAPYDGMFMLVTDPDGLVIEIWQRDSEAASLTMRLKPVEGGSATDRTPGN